MRVTVASVLWKKLNVSNLLVAIKTQSYLQPYYIVLVIDVLLHHILNGDLYHVTNASIIINLTDPIDYPGNRTELS